jgi:ketosteroid isomerase-like protein
MAEQNPAQSFGDALQQFEQDGDVDAFVDGVFTEDAELLRPEVHQRREGRDGAREFWRAYRAQFDSVRSEFTRIAAADSLGVLEWTSDGKIPGGGRISYSGVSLLDFDDSGRVRRFATYFDTARFGTGRSPG